MIADLLRDKEYQELEKEFKFLSRARGESILDQPCVIFDIETTGLEPTTNEITEIGALLIKGEVLQDMFSSLIKPKASISAEITRLTGIDDTMVKDAPPIDQVLPKFVEFVGSLPLIAHNAEFDTAFIKDKWKKIKNADLGNNIICTVKLSRYLLPQLPNHKLHTVAKHFGLEVANRHRAVGDAELTFQVWIKLLPLMKAKGLNSQRELDLLMSRL